MKINLKVYFLSFLFFSSSLSSLKAQSKFEFGIGILINHSKINEDVFVPLSPTEGSFKVRRQLALNTRVGYKLSDRFHLNSGAGFSWLGSAKKNQRESILVSTIDVPFLLEWNPKPFLHIFSGLNYNYVYGFSSLTDIDTNSLLPHIHTRHQFGLRHGIAISHKLVEFSLNYAHYFTDIFQSPITDVNGNDIGFLAWKFSNIQLGIIFRG